MNASAIEEKALALPVQERAKLIERLLESLDTLPEQEAETPWLDPEGALEHERQVSDYEIAALGSAGATTSLRCRPSERPLRFPIDTRWFVHLTFVRSRCEASRSLSSTASRAAPCRCWPSHITGCAPARRV